MEQKSKQTQHKSSTTLKAGNQVPQVSHPIPQPTQVIYNPTQSLFPTHDGVLVRRQGLLATPQGLLPVKQTFFVQNQKRKSNKPMEAMKARPPLIGKDEVCSNSGSNDGSKEKGITRRHPYVKISPKFMRLCASYGFHQTSACSYGDDCGYLHICRAWLAGFCEHQTSCRLKHTFIEDPHNLELIKNIRDLSEVKIRCDEFIRQLIYNAVPKICSRYNYSKCKTKNCFNLHLCKGYVWGTCTNPRCVLQHDYETRHNEAILDHFKIDTYAVPKLVFANLICPDGIVKPEDRIKECACEGFDDESCSDSDTTDADGESSDSGKSEENELEATNTSAEIAKEKCVEKETFLEDLIDFGDSDHKETSCRNTRSGFNQIRAMAEQKQKNKQRYVAREGGEKIQTRGKQEKTREYNEEMQANEQKYEQKRRGRRGGKGRSQRSKERQDDDDDVNSDDGADRRKDVVNDDEGRIASKKGSENTKARRRNDKREKGQDKRYANVKSESCKEEILRLSTDMNDYFNMADSYNKNGEPKPDQKEQIKSDDVTQESKKYGKTKQKKVTLAAKFPNQPKEIQRNCNEDTPPVYGACQGSTPFNFNDFFTPK